MENENARGIVKHYAVYDTDTGTFATNETVNKIELEYIAILPKTNLIPLLPSYDKKKISFDY